MVIEISMSLLILKELDRVELKWRQDETIRDVSTLSTK